MPSVTNLRRKRNRRTLSRNSTGTARGAGRRVHSGKVHSEMSLAKHSTGTEKSGSAAAPPAINGSAAANGSAASSAHAQHFGIITLKE
jgi:hypothetical protein